MDARIYSGYLHCPEQECNTRNGNVKQRQIWFPRVGKISSIPRLNPGVRI